MWYNSSEQSELYPALVCRTASQVCGGLCRSLRKGSVYFNSHLIEMCDLSIKQYWHYEFWTIISAVKRLCFYYVIFLVQLINCTFYWRYIDNHINNQIKISIMSIKSTTYQVNHIIQQSDFHYLGAWIIYSGRLVVIFMLNQGPKLVHILMFNAGGRFTHHKQITNLIRRLCSVFDIKTLWYGSLVSSYKRWKILALFSSFSQQA